MSDLLDPPQPGLHARHDTSPPLLPPPELSEDRGGRPPRRPLHAGVGASERRTLDAHEWRRVLDERFAEPPSRRGTLVTVQLTDLAPAQDRMGPDALAEAQRRVADVYHEELGDAAWFGWRRSDRLDIVIVGAPPGRVLWPLERAARAIAVTGIHAGTETLHLSPMSGVTDLADSGAVVWALNSAGTALEASLARMDLVPRVDRPGRARSWRRPLRVAPPAERRATGAARRLLRHNGTLAVAGYLLGIGVPLLVMNLAWMVGTDISGAVFALAALAGVFTCWTLWMEVLHALRRVDPPSAPTEPVPMATAVVAAYLPNEAATIEDTIGHFLRMHPDGGLQVVLAYNTPTRLPVQDRLAALATADPRLELLQVEGSTSKAQNINAALPRCRGAVVGIFDADHHPMPEAFERAWEWLGSGYDVVQGHCLVRNGDASLTARTVAVEFEGIYAVSHPGRTRWHGFGIFGGSNGYWRAEVLRGMRFRDDMLTEDIDSSIRTLTLGGRFASDPYLTSTELAPGGLRALWHQRLRWAQGWFQVMRRRLPSCLRARDLGRGQKAGLALLLGWTQLVPWICMLPLPLVVFALQHRDVLDVHWDVPLYLLVGVLSLVTSAGQVLAGYAVAHPSVRQHRRWFLLAAAVLPLYAEFKNAAVRTAHLRELVGGRDWIVTPRGREAGR